MPLGLLMYFFIATKAPLLGRRFLLFMVDLSADRQARADFPAGYGGPALATTRKTTIHISSIVSEPPLSLLVEMGRFELPTSCLQSRRSNQLSYIPNL